MYKWQVELDKLETGEWYLTMTHKWYEDHSVTVSGTYDSLKRIITTLTEKVYWRPAQKGIRHFGVAV